MFVNWLRKFFPSPRPLANGRRNRKAKSGFRPEVLQLEDRLSPAVVGTLAVSGNYLLYTGNSSDNNITISGSDGAFNVKDTNAISGVDTITYAGASFDATLGPTIAIPAGVTTIYITPGGGTDTVTVPAAGLTTTRGILANANTFDIEGNLKTGGINFTTPAAGSILLNAAMVTSNQSPNAGAIYLYGPVSMNAGTHTITSDGVTDGNILIYGNLIGSGAASSLVVSNLTGPETPGGNFTALGSITLTGDLKVGSAGAGANNIALYKSVIAAGKIDLEAENAITLYASVFGTGVASDVTLYANRDGLGGDSFTQSSGDIITNSTTPTAISLKVNNVGAGTGNATIHDLKTGAGGTINITIAGPSGRLIKGNATGALNASTTTGTLSIVANGGVNLDTSVLNLDVSTTSGDVTIRNTGTALSIDGSGVFATNGNVSISNDPGIDLAGPVVANAASKSATLTSTMGAITDSSGSSVKGSTINLSAATGIGAAGFPIIIGNAATISAADGILGGILLQAAFAEKIANAVAQGGDVSITVTGATNDLTVAGKVVAMAGQVLLTSGRSVLINANSLVSSSAAMQIQDTVSAAGNFILASGAQVSSGSTFQLNPIAEPFATTDSIAGSLVAAGDITINGATGAGHATTFTVGGSITGSANFTILSAGTGGTDKYTLGGPVSASGLIKIDSATGQNINLSVGAQLVSSGNDVDLFTTNVVGTLTISNHTALISGNNVVLNGGSGANVFNLSGPITATTGTITIDLSAGAGSVVTSSGQFSSVGGTLVRTSLTAADTLAFAPSPTSTFTFFVGPVGLHSLTIKGVALANTVGLPSNGFTFTGAVSPVISFTVGGYLPWTLSGHGAFPVVSTLGANTIQVFTEF
jgi:hypothetical protein